MLKYTFPNFARLPKTKEDVHGLALCGIITTPIIGAFFAYFFPAIFDDEWELFVASFCFFIFLWARTHPLWDGPPEVKFKDHVYDVDLRAVRRDFKVWRRDRTIRWFLIVAAVAVALWCAKVIWEDKTGVAIYIMGTFAVIYLGMALSGFRTQLKFTFTFQCPSFTCNKLIYMNEPWVCSFCSTTNSPTGMGHNNNFFSPCHHCHNAPHAHQCPWCGFVFALVFHEGAKIFKFSKRPDVKLDPRFPQYPVEPVAEPAPVPVPPFLPDGIPFKKRFQHTLIIAGSGWGKTQLMQALLYHDLQKHASVAIVDSQGPFLEQVLRQRDKGDLIYIDFTDPEDAPCLSMFDVKLSDEPKERERVLLGTLELYKYVFSALIGSVLTPRQTTLLSYLSELMISIDGANLRTMKDVMFDPTPFTKDIRHLRRDASDFFAMEFQTKEWGEVKKQLLDRLNAILGNTVLMRIFTQPKSKIDLYKAINTGKTIVVNTSVNHLQSEGTSILGRFFIAMLFQAALRRTGEPGKNKPTFLYLDEAWQYLDDKLPELYNMARKYDLGLVLASQQITHFSAKSPTLRNAAFSSAILFGGRVSNKEDKELIAECGMGKESSTSSLQQQQDAGKPISSLLPYRGTGRKASNHSLLRA